MALSAAFLDELRARTSLSALVGQSVKLSRAGREHKGCCPFHQEKTPSFTVNDDKGFYHCFGCGAHGDALRWLTDHGGLPFMDAVRQLADAAGMEVPARSPEAAARAERIDGIRPALEAAQALYVRELEQTGAAREYLHGRGYDAAAVARFGLGWAPTRRGHLRDIGLGFDLALAAGLAWQGDEGRTGETFRGRVMIPVHDVRGRLVGFAGRVLDASEPKYKNSPATEIFDKGRLLFNAHRAIDVLRADRAACLIIVEGQFDAMTLDLAGLAAVAPMGTALTAQQLEQAWRMTNAPVLLFDGDAAGLRAARRAAELALPLIGPGRGLVIACMPGGMDPDDAVRRDGRGIIDMVVAEARGVAAWLFNAVADDCADRDSPDAVAAVWHALEALAGTITDAETRAQYLALWRGRYDAELSLSARLRPDAAPVHALIEAEEGGFHWPEGEDESAQLLHRIVQAKLDIRAERRGLTERNAAIDAYAKSKGFVPKEINVAVRAAEMEQEARLTSEAVQVSYRRALGMNGPMTEAVLPVVRGAALGAGAAAPRRAIAPPLRRMEAMIEQMSGGEA